MTEIVVCQHCERIECVCRWCIVCQRRRLDDHEIQACDRCVQRVRANLDSVVELYALLPAELAASAYKAPQIGRIGGHSAETPLMGGDILALLSGGSDGRTDAQDDDPESVAWTLASWEDDWRHTRSHDAASGPATVVAAAAYLGVHLGWAANWHPAFDEFACDLRRLANRLGEATKTTQRVLRAPVPCFDCGGTLIRDWTDAGLVDDWQCGNCRRVYRPEAYWLAVKAAMEREAG